MAIATSARCRRSCGSSDSPAANGVRRLAMQRAAEWQLVRELSEWEPQGGVVSIYFEIDPGDRGEGWRIALREELDNMAEAVAERVLRRYPEGRPHPSGRTQI